MDTKLCISKWKDDAVIPDDNTLVAQPEPLWVGMMHSGMPISGRVVGWQWDRSSAMVGGDNAKPTGMRGRAVVLVHGCNDDSLGPVLTIDAGWPAHYVDTAEAAWQAALDLTAESKKRMDESHAELLAERERQLHPERDPFAGN